MDCGELYAVVQINDEQLRKPLRALIANLLEAELSDVDRDFAESIEIVTHQAKVGAATMLRDRFYDLMAKGLILVDGSHLPVKPFAYRVNDRPSDEYEAGDLHVHVPDIGYQDFECDVDDNPIIRGHAIAELAKAAVDFEQLKKDLLDLSGDTIISAFNKLCPCKHPWETAEI